jgi:hypothetical protein
VVRAIRFDRRLSKGKTMPALIGAEDGAGRELDVVVKFGHRMVERGDVGLVAEAIAAMFGRDLGLAVAPPYAVRISEEFVNSIPNVEVAPDFQKAMPVTFGSEMLVGHTLISASNPLPAGLTEQAGDVFAFDAVLDNADRRPENPNCMTDGHRLALIDHELTFLFATLFLQPPWVVNALEHWRTGVPHLFFNDIRQKNLTLARLRSALADIKAERCDEYIAALPAEWRASFGEEAAKMVQFIRDLKANIPATFTELRRVLA